MADLASMARSLLVGFLLRGVGVTDADAASDCWVLAGYDLGVFLSPPLSAPWPNFFFLFGILRACFLTDPGGLTMASGDGGLPLLLLVVADASILKMLLLFLLFIVYAHTLMVK
jgi:hypothetical protein